MIAGLSSFGGFLGPIIGMLIWLSRNRLATLPYRDHVMPISRGGKDCWENVVAACFHCNSRKGGRTPQQASMPLLAVPYRPSWVEHLVLSNRNILADQMAFLKNHMPKRKPRFN